MLNKYASAFNYIWGSHLLCSFLLFFAPIQFRPILASIIYLFFFGKFFLHPTFLTCTLYTFKFPKYILHSENSEYKDEIFWKKTNLEWTIKFYNRI